MKILISGGGIGGLTTAICLLQKGHRVKIFESAAALGDSAGGAGIQIPPNAMKVFQAIGIAEKIAENAAKPKRIQARIGKNGAKLFAIPLANEAEKQWGAPYLNILRAELIKILKRETLKYDPNALELGATVKDCRQNPRAAVIILQDGREIAGDILIGADGIRSPIAARIFADEKPIFTGNIAWRTVVPLEKLGADAPDNASSLWIGRGRHCVAYRLPKGNRGEKGAREEIGEAVNFVGVVARREPPPDPDRSSLQKARHKALRDFDGWHPVITRILKESDSLFRQALFERPPLKRWTDGRIALLGDAAHPMLPFMAQGAAMAIEDAWTIAAALSPKEKNSAPAAISTALKAYERMRHSRVRAVQEASRANAVFFHPREPIGEIMTYGAIWLADKIAPEAIRARTDWIYGYDVTRLPDSRAASDR